MTEFFTCVVIAMVVCACAVIYHPRPKAAPVTSNQIKSALACGLFYVAKSPRKALYPARLHVGCLELQIHIKTATEIWVRQRGYRAWQPAPEDTYETILAAYANSWS